MPHFQLLCTNFSFEINTILAHLKRIDWFCRWKWQHSAPVAPVLPPHKNPHKNHTQVFSACSLRTAQAQCSISATQFPILGAGFHLPPLSVSLEGWQLHILYWSVTSWKCPLLHPRGTRCCKALGSASAGREMSFPCSGEVQKAVGIPGFHEPRSEGGLEALPMTQDPARSCLAQGTASRAQIFNRIHKNLHRKPRFVSPLSLGAAVTAWMDTVAPKTGRAMASLLNLG